MYGRTTNADIMDLFRSGNVVITGGAVAWGSSGSMSSGGNNAVVNQRRKKKKKVPFPFKVKDTDVTTKATKSKREHGPEKAALAKAAGKKTLALPKKKPSAKVSGGGWSQTSQGPGSITNFRVNGEMVFPRVIWKRSMVLNKEDGLVIDGEMVHTFVKGDSWSIGTMDLQHGASSGTFTF